MYLVGKKYYMSFDELDEIEERIEKEKDVLSIEKEITEDDLENLIENAKRISEKAEEKVIEYLLYVKAKFQENPKLYRNQKDSIKLIDKVINRHVEVMDEEELKDFLKEKGITKDVE